MRSREMRIVAALSLALGLISIGAGLWALLAPESFYAGAATYPPYNRHLIHDIGAFTLGLGSCLVAGLVVRDALLAVLAGNAVAGAAHFASHVADSSRGGRASDPATFGVLAALFALLVLARWRTRDAGERPARR